MSEYLTKNFTKLKESISIISGLIPIIPSPLNIQLPFAPNASYAGQELTTFLKLPRPFQLTLPWRSLGLLVSHCDHHTEIFNPR